MTKKTLNKANLEKLGAEKLAELVQSRSRREFSPSQAEQDAQVQHQEQKQPQGIHGEAQPPHLHRHQEREREDYRPPESAHQIDGISSVRERPSFVISLFSQLVCLCERQAVLNEPVRAHVPAGNCKNPERQQAPGWLHYLAEQGGKKSS